MKYRAEKIGIIYHYLEDGRNIELSAFQFLTWNKQVISVFRNTKLKLAVRKKNDLQTWINIIELSEAMAKY